MRLYYDCEFLEDGRTIDLISIGMVAEDGRELYAVNEDIETDPLHSRICRHRWLMENVVPHLPLSTGRTGAQKGHGLITTSSTYLGFFNLDMTSNDVMPPRMIRNAVRDFILATPDVELWAWYGAYDHVALAQLWGRMIDLPAGVPMWTNDLRQEAARLGLTDGDMPTQAEGEHNALADARHNKAIAAYLADLPGEAQ
ncbi:3'-5' exoribonuclease domain-containing protein [Streptosporangium sandarakinum]